MTRNELIDLTIERLTLDRPYLRRRPVKKLLKRMAIEVFNTIGETLSEGENVQIGGLGAFTIYTDPGRVVRSPSKGTYELPPTKRLKFRPSRWITQRLKEDTMEKYGVEQDPDKTKTASETKTCPKCGSDKVDWSGHVPVCPNCGTEPFEKRESDR